MTGRMYVLYPVEIGLSSDFTISALPLSTKIKPLRTLVTFRGVKSKFNTNTPSIIQFLQRYNIMFIKQKRGQITRPLLLYYSFSNSLWFEISHISILPSSHINLVIPKDSLCFVLNSLQINITKNFVKSNFFVSL
jgi:hypothetical protein